MTDDTGTAAVPRALYLPHPILPIPVDSTGAATQSKAVATAADASPQAVYEIQIHLPRILTATAPVPVGAEHDLVLDKLAAKNQARAKAAQEKDRVAAAKANAKVKVAATQRKLRTAKSKRQLPLSTTRVSPQAIEVTAALTTPRGAATARSLPLETAVAAASTTPQISATTRALPRAKAVTAASTTPGIADTTRALPRATTSGGTQPATSPTNFVGHKVGFDPLAWVHIDILLLCLKKRKKYFDAICITEECLENGRVVGTIKRWDQRQHSNLYNIEFECKTFKNLMLPADEVHPYLVGVVGAGAQQSDLMGDSNRITRMINHVLESDLGPCPESDDAGGDDLDLTAESDCVWIISDSDPLDDATWNRKKNGKFSFMDQDAYDDLPTLVGDADVHEK
jgi:hypothetical protein